MKPNRARDLEILTAIGEGAPLTQRALSERLGVALGLTNLYLKRLAHKGYIKIVEFPKKPAARKRLRYLVTPKGLAEKGRLTYEHMAYALNLYRRTRQTLRDSLGQLEATEMKRIALFGAGDAAELAYLTLREFGLEPVGVFADEAGARFLGPPLLPLAELSPDDVGAGVVAALERPEPPRPALARPGRPRPRRPVVRRRAPPLGRGGGGGGGGRA